MWEVASEYHRFAPSRVRGLKLKDMISDENLNVRTFTGAWIETFVPPFCTIVMCSHLHGCVDWNTALACERNSFKFAPSRVRGLKLFQKYIAVGRVCVRTFTGAWIETLATIGHIDTTLFAPSRVRGLKLKFNLIVYPCSSSHLHGCVDWNHDVLISMTVSPFAPSRVRGLKLFYRGYCRQWQVRTFTGAWIETEVNNAHWLYTAFAPSRVRGLKLVHWILLSKRSGSHLHGCVDWNIIKPLWVS